MCCPPADGHANASDEALLAIACREDRVLATEDKDFGELVFLRGLPHPCIVGLDGLTAMEEAAVMRDLIERQGAAMRKGAIIVVTARRVRIRPAEHVESGNDLDSWETRSASNGYRRGETKQGRSLAICGGSRWENDVERNLGGNISR